MELGLRGKRALVTGSTAGIRLATARLLAEEGAIVTWNGRSDARVNAAVDEVRRYAAGAAVTGIAADLATANGCAAVVAAVPEIDILVNNMGIFEPKPFEEIPDADW